jgi:hypothetical protein
MPELTYSRRTGICLNMIVKNETPVLARLFHSLREVIDYYVIVDTGSTDGTPAFIEQWMAHAGIAGEVHRRAWVNFGVNRDQALQLAIEAGKSDWLLLIDADEELAFNDPAIFTRLSPGVSYSMEKVHGNTRYRLPNLVDIRQNRWRWCMPVHEYLEHLQGPNLRQDLDPAWIIYHQGEGARSRGKTAEEKFLADAVLLEQQLTETPNDPRSRFYLAQSYRDAGHLQAARENYLLRAALLQGWSEETFFAQYQAGRLAIRLGLPHETVREDLLAAVNLRPSRAEPLHALAAHCRGLKRWGEALAFAGAGVQLPRPNDRLFLEQDVYDWRLLDELSVAAYWTGHYAMSRDAAQQILTRADDAGLQLLPDNRKRVQENLQFALDKLN